MAMYCIEILAKGHCVATSLDDRMDLDETRCSAHQTCLMKGMRNFVQIPVSKYLVDVVFSLNLDVALFSQDVRSLPYSYQSSNNLHAEAIAAKWIGS